MQKKMYRRSLVIGVILLFFGASVVSISGDDIEVTNMGNIDIFDSSEGKETTLQRNVIYVPDDYSTIQEAVINANDNDLIFVYSDIYYSGLNGHPQIEIDKQIELRGESKDTTVIIGKNDDSVIKIRSCNVTISGFTIKNGDNGIWAKTRPDYEMNLRFVTISDNSIIDNNYGVHLEGWYYSSQDNTINNNNISNNSVGIRLESTNNNSIYSNNITYNNQKGIEISSSYSLNNSIWLNNISYNDFDGENNGYGIYNFGSDKTKIWDNIIRYNENGMRIYSGDNIEIINNDVISNNYKGIFLDNSQHCTIFDNHIEANDFGINMVSSEYSTISDNTIINHLNHQGILAQGGDHNIIINNNIESNEIGINLCNYGSGKPHKNVINNNTIIDNLYYGIVFSPLGMDMSNPRILTPQIPNDPDGPYYNEISENYISSPNYPDFTGIRIDQSCDNNITDNTIVDSNNGVHILFSSEFNNISENTIMNNIEGIIVERNSNYNRFIENDINNNGIGINIIKPPFQLASNNNTIYHNNFIENTCQGYDECENYWYNDTLNEGNYWDDYIIKYPNASPRIDDPRIWDTPYEIPPGVINRDLYPFLNSSGWKTDIDPEQSSVTLIDWGLHTAFEAEWNEGGKFKVTVINQDDEPVIGLTNESFDFTVELGENASSCRPNIMDYATFVPLDDETNANGEIRFQVVITTGINCVSDDPYPAGYIILKANVSGIELVEEDFIYINSCDLSPEGEENGWINLVDFSRFQVLFGNQAQAGDFDLNGIVNLADFSDFQIEFGSRQIN